MNITNCIFSLGFIGMFVGSWYDEPNYELFGVHPLCVRIVRSTLLGVSWGIAMLGIQYCIYLIPLGCTLLLLGHIGLLNKSPPQPKFIA